MHSGVVWAKAGVPSAQDCVTRSFSVMIDMIYMIYPNDNAIRYSAIGLPAVVVCGIITGARFKLKIAGSGQ
jgi:hypothetical protein